MQTYCKRIYSDFINPNENIFGGEYDANILFVAMQKYQRNCDWFDKRKQFQIIEEPGKEVEGYLVNIKIQEKFYQKLLGLSGRHWMCIKWAEVQAYVEYDSLQQEPSILGEKKFV